jgi:flagellar hook assembly protein FlgD
VATLVARAESAGRHVVTWDGRDARGQRVASGVYLVRLTAGTTLESTRVVLLK